MKLFRNKNNTTAILCFLLLSGIVAFSGCKKLIEINPPVNSTGNEVTFKDDVNATMALSSVYSSFMLNERLNITNGGMTVYTGLLADELYPIMPVPGSPAYEFYSAHLRSDNAATLGLWNDTYKSIFFANSVMEGAAASTSTAFTEKTRTLIAGETRAARAFCYYYLVNTFGAVPMPLTADVSQVTRLPRTSVSEVNQQIIKDLTEAADLLPENYDAFGGEKVRINKYAATALLARTYLFDKKYEEAITAADKVINSGKYSLETLDNVFQPNSAEAIWQLKLNTTGERKTLIEAENLIGMLRTIFSPPGYVEMISQLFPPEDFDGFATLYFYPTYRLAYNLVDAFEPNDQRKTKWIDSLYARPDGATNGRGIFMSIKHERYLDDQGVKVGPPYFMALRLAEQYLIRAEAKAQLNDIEGAAADLNAIRKRAGLENTTATNKEAMLTAIMHERQTELFCEWGNRFIDLKRTNKATEVLSQIDYKQPWSADYLLFPIPQYDLISNSALTQNPGYN